MLLVARQGDGCCEAESGSALVQGRKLVLYIAPAVDIAHELRKGEGVTHATRTRQGPHRTQEAPEKHSASESAGEGEADETSETVGHRGNDHFDEVSRASADVTPSDYVCPETSSAS
jgi:hypothetical protein